MLSGLVMLVNTSKHTNTLHSVLIPKYPLPANAPRLSVQGSLEANFPRSDGCSSWESSPLVSRIWP